MLARHFPDATKGTAEQRCMLTWPRQRGRELWGVCRTRRLSPCSALIAPQPCLQAHPLACYRCWALGLCHPYFWGASCHPLSPAPRTMLRPAADCQVHFKSSYNGAQSDDYLWVPALAFCDWLSAKKWCMCSKPKNSANYIIGKQLAQCGWPSGFAIINYTQHAKQRYCNRMRMGQEAAHESVLAWTNSLKRLLRPFRPMPIPVSATSKKTHFVFASSNSPESEPDVDTAPVLQEEQ